MQRRAFGHTGLVVPVLGFGSMQAGDPRLPEEAAARLLNHALDLGLTLIDTARSYGLSEERIGRHLAHRRDEFVLSTKVGYGVDGVPDWTYDCIVAGVQAARDRLRSDTIDIVHLHSCGLDLLEAGEATRALADCAARGWLRVAAYSGDGAELRHAVLSGEFGAVQASLNLCDQQALRVLAEAGACGMGTIAKRPLGRPPTTCTPTTGNASRRCAASLASRRTTGSRLRCVSWLGRGAWTALSSAAPIPGTSSATWQLSQRVLSIPRSTRRYARHSSGSDRTGRGACR